METRIIIWGSSNANKCQEQDLLSACRERGINAEVWNQYCFSSKIEQLRENSKRENKKQIQYSVIIRNLFYKQLGDYSKYQESDLVKKLRQIEENAIFLSNIDGLIAVRDKLEMNKVFRELKVPHIKAYELETKPLKLLSWINEVSERFSNGVIIKDRFGGQGKGIIRVEKQGSLYLCDLSCVDGVEQKYINETLNSDELKAIFGKYFSDYFLIGQPYIKSSHEFRMPRESESVRVLDIGGGSYIAMKRIAESPINNLSLTKYLVVDGDIQKTVSTEQVSEFCKRISEQLGLFLTGYDFIRTNTQYYCDDHGAVYIPKDMRGGNGEISLMLEVNGLVQYAGIQELYRGEVDVSDCIASVCSSL